MLYMDHFTKAIGQTIIMMELPMVRCQLGIVNDNNGCDVSIMEEKTPEDRYIMSLIKTMKNNLS